MCAGVRAAAVGDALPDQQGAGGEQLIKDGLRGKRLLTLHFDFSPRIMKILMTSQA